MATNGITTLGNRTFLFGGASGIDTSSLITAAYNAKKSQADKIDVQVKKNVAKFEAYDKIKTLSNAVKTSLANIQKNYSILAGNTDLFDQRTGSLSTNTAVSATSLVDVKLDPGTTLGAHEIIVQTKGQAQRVTSDSSTSATDPLGYTGSFSIGIAGKTASSVNVTSGMTLTDLAAAINTSSSTTGVTATIAKVSDTSYQMVLTGSDINKAIQITGVTGTDVMQSVGVTDGLGGYPNILQPAQPTSIKVDGITYSRDSNSFSDIITGVTINVKSADPATTINLSVENDNSGVKAGIQSFITSYNALRDYIKSQQVVSDKGTLDSSVVLFGDTVMENLNRSLQGILGGSYGSGGTTLSTLRNVGITLDTDNKLVMDETKFDTALIDKFSEVRDIFQAKVTVDNTEFRMTKNTSTNGNQNFAMQITMSGGVINGVSVGGDSSLFDFSNGTITGKAGTTYEGMSFAYIGTTDTTVNINIQSGLSDTLSSTIDKFSDALNGDLTKEMNRISSQNTQLEQRSSRVLERAAAYRESLISKYAAFESKLAQAQTVLAQLQAITKSNNKD
ncbi:MAG: hypothetical protein A3J37_02225 [Alphaproteobacteria bacterium RIFCSPHIGHO2_12_FULL_45_9]|nr:MAG: hypothetical protein A3B66_01995 [Alphaproteobacteria bacterium RIFCSPHIGHO2_02_FULL_46_13]OFW96306.1 MAG: hypothetical protein A3J37_02225 [Alphaproteobacteria bacterium RIFCSPHIGHO2_12_FULL_45_9]